MKQPIPSQYYHQAQELKKLGREIASYPDDRFGSNCLSNREVRMQYYVDARQYLSGEATDYQWLPTLIEEACNDISKLKSGEKVLALICF